MLYTKQISLFDTKGGAGQLSERARLSCLAIVFLEVLVILIYRQTGGRSNQRYSRLNNLYSSPFHAFNILLF